MGLDGTTVIVTGAAGGIGGRYVHAFAAQGADVVATDVPDAAERGAALAGKAGADGPGRAVFVPGDITSDDDWARVVERARAEFGGVAALVNNAAI